MACTAIDLIIPHISILGISIITTNSFLQILMRLQEIQVRFSREVWTALCETPSCLPCSPRLDCSFGVDDRFNCTLESLQ